MADDKTSKESGERIQESRDYTLRGEKIDKSITRDKPVMTTPPPPPPDKPAQQSENK